MSDNDEVPAGLICGGIGTAILLLIGLITLTMWGCPQYHVYEQRMQGQSQLAHAQASKEVAVAEAKARMESASLLAQAEVTRAEGVAKANKIIGDSLKGNESYLRYLWVNNLENSKNQVIYVPTEAGLPLMEATRLSNPPSEK
jgi:regulator of protease activity HflC (stomatin/prohibitin superfamily)